MYMDNKIYDALKWIAQYLLPGAATFYFTVGNIWNLPAIEGVVGTIMAVDVFLGAILGLSSMEYQKARLREGDVPLAMGSGADYTPQADTMPWELPSDIYDRIKWLAMIVLPASGTLYLALSGIWGFPYGEEVLGTVAAITTLLGVLLGFSSNQRNKSLKA